MDATLKALDFTADVVPADTPLHCDRCGALARVRIILASGSDLLFCAHHNREYGDKLRDIAVDIVELLVGSLA